MSYCDIIPTYILEFCLVINIFRIFLLLLEFKNLRFFFNNLFSFLPFISEVISMIIMLYMFFALLGMHLFGGKLNSETVLTLNGNTYNHFYKFSNFNDMPGSLLILFSLMIVNNWNNQVLFLL